MFHSQHSGYVFLLGLKEKSRPLLDKAVINVEVVKELIFKRRIACNKKM